MKIKITESEIKLNVDGQLVTYHEGDQVTVSDAIGELCVRHGWAEDLDGNIETGARIPGAAPITVNSLAQKSKV